MIHHEVHRPASTFEKGESGLKQSPCPLAVYRGHNDEPGVKFGATDQTSKVARILGDDHTVFGNRPCEDTVVRLTPAANVQRMDRVVTARSVEPRRQLGRQALINEQLHAACAQGRPPGRPMSGCVRA